MKRKSLLILAVLIAALTCLFTSCSASVEPPTSEEEMAYVTFGNEGSRALYTEYGITPYDDLFWDYDAVKKDGYGTTGAATKAPVSKDFSDKQITGLDGTVGPLSQGAWEFMLYAYEAVNGVKTDNLVYQGKSDIVVLKGGETKAIPVSVELKGAKGKLNFTDAYYEWKDGGTGDVYLRINISGVADNNQIVDATRITKVTNVNSYKIMSSIDFGYGYNLFPAGYYTCTVQAYVAGNLNQTQTEVNSDSTYKASQSFGLRVYGNAITYIKGNLEESLFADVIFDVEKQDMKVFRPNGGTETTVPDIAVTPSGESGKTTSVTFSSGALPSVSEGETLQLDVKVTPMESSNQKFEISGTTDDNKSAFAGIDITLWKTDSNGSSQVSNFEGKTATVTTYIAKKLSNVSVHYKRTDSDGKNIKTYYEIQTLATDSEMVTIPEGKDGVYYQDTGKLIFITTHFSEYYVLADCEAIIKSINVGYASIYDAVEAAAEMTDGVDNTVTLTRDVTLTKDLQLGSNNKGVNLNLNGKTINGGTYQVYTAGTGTSTIFGNGTITNSNSTQNANFAPLRIYNGSNVVLDGVTVTGEYCGVKNSGNLTIKKATITGKTFGLGCFGSGTTNIGIAGGNNSDVIINAVEQALATAAASGSSDMIVNVFCGTLTSTGTQWDDCPAYWASHGKLNVYGGTFKSESTGDVAAMYQKNGTVNIHDGTFSARNGVKLGAEQDDCTEINLNIFGGTITGTRHAALYYKTTEGGSSCTAYNINISGGEFTGASSKGAIHSSIVSGVITPVVHVTGGKFSSNPREYLGNNYQSIEDGNYWIVSSIDTSDDIVILNFLDDNAVTSRGLTNFPTDGNPFFRIEDGDKSDLKNIVPNTNYGFWMSCNVMRSLPIFPGLKSVNASADAFVNSIKNKDLKGYGFPLKVVDAKKTNDGVYIIYNVLEDGEVNGRIEYYYSTVEKKFSYREIVAPLFGLTGGDQIFVFEMFNVPVEKAQDGYKFKAGKLYDNGSEFRHVSFLSDTIGRSVQNLPLGEIDRFNVEDSQLVMNYNGNKVTSMEYEKYISNKPISETNYNYVCVPLNQLTGGSITTIDVSNRANALTFEKQIDFLKKIFNESSFAFEGYNSLSDFNSSSLEYLAGKQDILENYTTYTDYEYNGIGFPLSYDLDKNIGACLYNNNGTVNEIHFAPSAQGAYSFTPFVLDKFKKCFGIEDEITSYDQFVQFMFKDLDLSEYAENKELRKGLLADSYN